MQRRTTRSTGLLSRTMLALALLGGGSTWLAAGCKRPDIPQCTELCWRYNELHFWDKFEADAKNLSVEDKEALRAERQAAWEEIKARKIDPGLDNCVRDCRKGGRPEDVTCVLAATSGAEAKACLAE